MFDNHIANQTTTILAMSLYAITRYQNELEKSSSIAAGKKPSDPAIAEKFNTCRFAGYKEMVSALLKRVRSVSMETMRIVGEMK